MRRRLLNFLTLLSLLLCAAVVALWVGSHTRPTHFALRTATSYAGCPSLKFIEAESQVGAVELCFYVETNPSSMNRPYTPAQRASYRAENQPAFAAVAWFRQKPIRRPRDPFQSVRMPGVRRAVYWSMRSADGTPHYRSNDDEFPGVYRLRYVTLAYWPLCALLSAPPALWLWRERRARRRARRGLCPRCGYDLRASPDRFPECGHAPAGVAA